MGNCIICGTSTDGPICEVHEEDVVFDFEGNDPSQLKSGRFYRGTVDGYADFGVFVNIGNVTGLLHRSKLDRRLENIDWEVGDEISVQVNNVRDNGDIDLNWSIRQKPEDFRGVLKQTPEGDELVEKPDRSAEADEPTTTPPVVNEPVTETPERATTTEPSEATPTEESPQEEARPTEAIKEPITEAATTEQEEETATADRQTGGNPGESTVEEASTEEPDVEPERVAVETLEDRVGETVRLEGEVASVRQTSGPTVFEIRDESGGVECAAFLEAGVRAYPGVEESDIVQLDGDVELRRDEIQVETDDIVVLEGEERDQVETRMAEALEERASPETVEPLGADPEIDAIIEDIESVATDIRRAVVESRPIVVRHDATTDGYVAGAAIERAVLPLIEAEHGTGDSVYHYFDRRPLEEGVYDMNDATKDVTRMLGDRDRHGEKLPLFVFAAAASTVASTDGLELLDIYDAPRVVLDGRAADEAVVDDVDSLATTETRTAGTVAATIAAAVNGDVSGDLRHLPAVSYWADTPETYYETAIEAGIDAEAAKQLREAIALEAYYQSYEDKRELIIDLLFEKRTELAEQVSAQFVTKLDAELDTVTPNLEERTVGGATVTVLDTDAFTHRYDFPPTRLLLDELSRRLDSDAVVGVGTDELHIRSDADLDLSAVVSELASAVPDAGVADSGARQPKLEFLAGERDAVIEATVTAVADAIAVPSA